MLTSSTLFPYITLGLLVVAFFVIRFRTVLSGLVLLQLALGFAYGVVTPLGLLAMGVFWGICEYYWCNSSSKEWFNSIKFLIIAILALGFANHLIPGFHNLRAIEAVKLSSSSYPFTMFLNFDKTMAAVVLALASSCLFKQSGSLGKKNITSTVQVAGLGLALLIPLAVWSGYITFDPKFPETFWLWAFNNLLFVCFAEEVIFRGIFQNALMHIAKRWQISPFAPIVITSVLFGTLLIGHVHGGPIYMAFAIIAGGFYGYAYYATNRLESAILVHFIVNLTHYALFSYPMAVNVIP